MIDHHPEFQRQEPHLRGVSIARLIASEFATPESLVIPILRARDTTIEIDDTEWDGDPEFIPREKLIGKTIAILGVSRQWKLKYPESE